MTGMFSRIVASVVLLLCLVTATASAQQQSEEDRLRDALRRVTVDLRTAQDNQTALQASLDQAQKQRDLLQQQVTQLTAQLAAAQAAQKPAQPAQPTVDVQQIQDAVDALKKQNAALQDGLGHWQAAYQQAAMLARTKDAQQRASSAAATTAQRTLDVCEAKNTKLIAVAQDILHLYQTPHFRSLARDNWDALLGFKRVELENIVQAREDRILDQKYYPGEQPAPVRPAAASNTPAAASNKPAAAARAKP